jgi:hypothetical protein
MANTSLSWLETLLEIVHPLIIPYLDYDSVYNVRQCSKKLHQIIQKHQYEPERIFNDAEFLPVMKNVLYVHRWVRFWAIDLDDETDEVHYDDSILLYVKEWMEVTDYHDSPILIARGITKWENEVPIPSVYDGIPIESRKRRQWCLKSIYVDLSKSIAFYPSRAWMEPNVFRVHSDYVYDGRGYEPSLVSIPVWKSANLGIPPEMRKKFLEHFLQMGSEIPESQRQDVVHDIMDPDLCVAQFLDHSREALVARMSARVMGDTMNYIQYFNHRLRDVKYLEFPKPLPHLFSIQVPLREHYHWVPSDLVIEPTGRVQFLSPIHGVDERFQTETQRIFASILQRMLPLISQGEIMRHNEPTKLQVIFKVQRYVLMPFSTHKGTWHVDGLTENLLYSGIYCVENTFNLLGGEWKFRNSGTHEIQSLNEVCHRDVAVRMDADSALLYSSFVPHRLMTLVNNTNQIASKTLIHFFVIDPAKPLASSATIVNFRTIDEANTLKEKFHSELSTPNFRSGFACIKWGKTATLEFLDHTTKNMCEEYVNCGILSDSSDEDQ